MLADTCRTESVVLTPFALEGILATPRAARGLIVFAHGSGSSRFSQRNAMVAAALRRAGFATLLFDLLTEQEAADRGNVFDIPLLAERLDQACTWALRHGRGVARPLGLFGASTGAAAALAAAAERTDIAAVVSRGGRPDLVGPLLPRVTAPTLLIVGGNDPEVITLNRAAARLLRCPHRLEIVPGATHLFEEPGALETVVTLAVAWFGQHLHRVEAADDVRGS